jgi:cell division protein FtsW
MPALSARSPANPEERSPARIIGDSLDWLVLATVVLCCLGIVLAVSVGGPQSEGGAMTAMRGQGSKLFVGLVAFLVCAVVPLHLLWRFSPLAFWFSTGLVYFAAFFGAAVNGASRWIGFAGFQFQPVELARVFGVLYIARLIAESGAQIRTLRGGTVRVMLPALVLAGGLLIQPDHGNAAFVLALFGVMAIVGGVPLLHFLLLAIPGIAALIYVILQQDYAVDRLLGFMEPERGGQVWQSLVAISSGGLLGRGLGDGWMKMGFVPEAQNDFVFAVLGEELGLLGTTVVLSLYVTLGVMGMRLVLNCRDRFLRSIVFGFVVALCAQAAINLLVVTGMAPAKGIDLPFLSSGGTSLVACLAAVGLVGNAARADARYYSGRQ